jgi:hypothetical protein
MDLNKFISKMTPSPIIEGFEMGEKVQTMNTTGLNATMIIVIGAIVAILGVAIIEIPHMPGRGSGIGTILLVIGLIVLFFGLYRRRITMMTPKTG